MTSIERISQKSGVGAASAAREPCALRLKAHLQKLIPGLHVQVCAKPTLQFLS